MTPLQRSVKQSSTSQTNGGHIVNQKKVKRFEPSYIRWKE